MNTNSVLNPIPLEVATQLCSEIRQEAERNWHTAAARWCWNCQNLTGGDPAKWCVLQLPGNRGCLLVNARYAQIQSATYNTS
ncbi:MAG: hypothetical protein ACM3PY_11550 [Omnitrophica WOR_2 bacterium]